MSLRTCYFFVTVPTQSYSVFHVIAKRGCLAPFSDVMCLHLPPPVSAPRHLTLIFVPPKNFSPPVFINWVAKISIHLLYSILSICRLTFSESLLLCCPTSSSSLLVNSLATFGPIYSLIILAILCASLMLVGIIFFPLSL